MKKIILIGIILILLPMLGACALSKAKQVVKEETSTKFSFVGKSVEPFEVKDFNGVKIDEQIFKDQKLTMNVFWSPNCVPCIEELGALDKLKDMESELGFKLVSICVEGERKEVESLKENYQMQYPVIMWNENKLMQDCVKDFEFIPFVIFVDQNGRYLKEYLVGSRTYEEYLDHLRQLSKKL